MDGLGYVQYIAVVVQGDEDSSGVMKSCFVDIVVKDVVGRVGGRSVPTVERTVAASVTSGTSPLAWRATRMGRGVINSCFVVIVVNDVVGRVGGRSEPTVGGIVAASWTASGTFGTLPLSCRATRTAAVL